MQYQLMFIKQRRDMTVIQSFPSLAAAAKFLGVHYTTVSRYAKSGKIMLNKYIVSIKPGSNLCITQVLHCCLQSVL